MPRDHKGQQSYHLSKLHSLAQVAVRSDGMSCCLGVLQLSVDLLLTSFVPYKPGPHMTPCTGQITIRPQLPFHRQLHEAEALLSVKDMATKCGLI